MRVEDLVLLVGLELLKLLLELLHLRRMLTYKSHVDI